MRRKSTRAAAKASPEKSKEEKTPKKSRRTSKRHKQTSSESESEEEVSVSSNETSIPTTGGSEVWTVTQTEQSNNEVGKIKICLARPSPATPERTERVSKRLRNKPVVVEDSPPEEKPTRRTRRSRGGSSPVKKEEQLPLQQEAPEVCEEKKGKGKSKGKHKSKIVEQAASVVEQTEQQNEISENVQVTAQSPQNVDNSDAEIVDRDLNQFEDERSVDKCGEEPTPDNQDTNDNIVDASNNDISNNNVTNDNEEPVDEQSNDANSAGAEHAEESCSKIEEPPSDSDVSMREVTHFNISTCSSISEKVESKASVKDEQSQENEAEIKPRNILKSETLIKMKGESSSSEEDVKKDIKRHEDLVQSKEEVKEEVKCEPVKQEVSKLVENTQRDSMKVEDIIEEKCKKEEIDIETTVLVISQAVSDTATQQSKVEPEIVEKPEVVNDQSTPKPKVEDVKVQESVDKQEPEATPEQEVKPQVDITETTEKQEIQQESSELPEKVEETQHVEEPSTKESTALEVNTNESETIEKLAEEPTKVKVTKEKTPEPEKLIRRKRRFERRSQDTKNEEVTCKEVQSEETLAPKSKTTESANEDIKSTILDEELSSPKRPRVQLSWGETKSFPNITLVSSKKLKEIYPELALVDESNVKLEPRERPSRQQRDQQEQKAVADRRVSKEEKVELPPKLEREDSTSSNLSTTMDTTTTSLIALNRKISIVDDEASSLRPPPSPAKHDRASVLFITNLVRPFTVKQLRGLLERTGKIVDEGFWTDKIKSKCYVQYETEEEAEATRNAIHGVQWPIGNGKKLIIDFATIEDLETAKNPPVVVPVVPTVAKVEVEKENNEPPKKPSNVDIEHTDVKADVTSTQWPDKEMRKRCGRSASIDIKRRYSQSGRSRSASQEMKKKRREESAQQRAMDDLFRKTEATPSIYWHPLLPEEIALKQQQRLERMEAHKRKMEMQQTRPRRIADRSRGGGGPYRRRY